MWILAREKSLKASIHLGDKKYYDLTLTDKLEILRIVLSNVFEVYYREYEDSVCGIMIYNKEYNEFIHDDGLSDCNLEVFWNECIEDLIRDYNVNIALMSAS